MMLSDTQEKLDVLIENVETQTEAIRELDTKIQRLVESFVKRPDDAVITWQALQEELMAWSKGCSCDK